MKKFIFITALILLIILAGCGPVEYYFSISGYVKTAGGQGIPDVSIQVTTDISQKTVKTSSDGYWAMEITFDNAVVWTAVPSKTGYTFTPPSYVGGQGDESNVNFIGTTP